jgi:hypothetical protein
MKQIRPAILAASPQSKARHLRNFTQNWKINFYGLVLA